ncbi:MAG TPA: PIN domain-containing protein [Planctomycetota bacterium]|nr:PIN domain-containing protein [Planctomycetota bacterium]
MKVFVDTNVLLDVLAERKPFYHEAERVWSLAELGRMDGYVSAISFNNCYCIIHKYAGRRSADKAIRMLRDVFSPIDLTAQVLNQAIDAGFSDFEDAIQFHSAVHAKVPCIITRNQDHFPRTPLSILSPAEFLAAHSFE